MLKKRRFCLPLCAAMLDLVFIWCWNLCWVNSALIWQIKNLYISSWLVAVLKSCSHHEGYQGPCSMEVAWLKWSVNFSPVKKKNLIAIVGFDCFSFGHPEYDGQPSLVVMRSFSKTGIQGFLLLSPPVFSSNKWKISYCFKDCL